MKKFKRIRFLLLAVCLIVQFCFSTQVIAREGSVAVSEIDSAVVIANGLVSVKYNLANGTYDAMDLLTGKVIIEGAYSSVEGQASRTAGYTHTYTEETVADAVGNGKKVVITSEKPDALTLLLGITLYEGNGIIALSAGVKNTSGNAFRLKDIKPMAGSKVFNGFDVKNNISLLNGDSGAAATKVTHFPSLTAANNALVTFGDEGDNRSIVMGGLTYDKYPKFVAVDPIVNDEKARALCYIDLGTGITEATSETGEKVTQTQGGSWTYGAVKNSEKYDVKYRSISFHNNYLEYRISGLDPEKDYSFGMTFWDVDNDGLTRDPRAQSVSVDGQDIFGDVVLNFNRDDEPPQKFTFTIPKETYAEDQTVTVRVTNKKAAPTWNSVASDLWLLEGETPGGKTIEDVSELSDIDYSSFNMSLYAQDPLGMQLDAGTTYFPDKDTYYIDFMTDNPFEALEKYALTFRDAQDIDITPYNFPSVCLWYVEIYAGGGRMNTSAGAVEVMQRIKDSGFLNYSDAAVRLVPDYYGPNGVGGNVQQGWWDDEHWQMHQQSGYGNGKYVEPYETTAKWAGAVGDLGGIPLTYFQTSVVSADYADMYPSHTLYNDGKYVTGVWLNDSYKPDIGYDFTDTDFVAHMRDVYKNLKDGGVRGLMFDYPGTAWNTQGGFDDPYVTTGEFYKMPFKLAKEGLGSESFVHERCIESNLVSDITLGYVDSQRTEDDTSSFTKEMATKPGLRWYKNRVITAYDLDSKDLMKLPTTDALNSVLTMSYVISGRLLLANDFRQLSPEAFRGLTRIYPQHTELKSPRPIDAFVNEYPQVYDYEVTPDWHQVTLYNGDTTKEDVIEVPLSKDTAFGGLGLNPNAEYYVYDFWNNRYIGKFPGTDTLSHTLRANETRVLSIRKAQDNPQVVSTDRHILQGALDMKNVNWDGGSNTLSATSSIVKDDPYKAYIKLPDSQLLNVTSVTATAGDGQDVTSDYLIDRVEGILTLTLTADENADVDWTICFEASDVEPTETPPADIANIASYYATSDRVVHLLWTPSASDTGEVSYRVYRGTTPDFETAPYSLLAITYETSFKDDVSDLKDNTIFYYKVAAVDIWGNMSNPAVTSVQKRDVYPVVITSVDDTTRGSWIGTYGQEGYELYAFGSTSTIKRSWPSYVTAVTTNGSGYYMGTNTTSLSFLQNPDNPTNRVGGLVYGSTLNFTIETNDNKEHDISLYFYDNDNARVMSVAAFDDAGKRISEQVTMNNFYGGKYINATFKGNVTFKVSNLVGNNTVMGGIFFNSTSEYVPKDTSIAFTSPDISDMIVGAETVTRTFSARVWDYEGNETASVPSIGAVGDLPEGVSLVDGTIAVAPGAAEGTVILKAVSGELATCVSFNIKREQPVPTVITSVVVTTPTIVEKLGANLRVNVTGENLEGKTMTAYLSVNDVIDESTATDITSGTALMKIATAPDFGASCEVVVKVGGTDVQGFFILTLAAYKPEELWSPSLNEDENGNLLVCFAEPIAPTAKGYAASVKGTSYGCTALPDGNTLRVNVKLLDLEANDKIVISGVKYPILFPSYSFTFTLQV